MQADNAKRSQPELRQENMRIIESVDISDDYENLFAKR
jgi:hypothetical protein